MTLKTKILEDATSAFLNADEFAETVTYTPYGASPVSIIAVVDRQPKDGGEQDQGRAYRHMAEIYIANSATSGIASVDKGRDKVSFPVLTDGSAVDWVVVSIMAKDEGMWHLRVQR